MNLLGRAIGVFMILTEKFVVIDEGIRTPQIVKQGRLTMTQIVTVHALN
jgi:hypothetical protein